MLVGLSISNIVLIEKLNLEFGRGLNVLTGETGAGKSILLDALSLALGARSDVGLIRHGCENAQVVAEFDGIANLHSPLCALLNENGIESDGTLLLRRTLSIDGKNRALVNDIPVSLKVLKQIGDTLVEIHGQFENHSLLDQSTHRRTLDEFAIRNRPQYSELLADVKSAYTELHAAEKRLRELEELLEKSATERDFLEHNVAELVALAPQIGEEEELSAKRAAMISAEKNAAILAEATAAMSPKGNSLDSQIFAVAHILERIRGDINPYREQIDKLYEVANTLSEISNQLTPVAMDAAGIDSTEERLFAIRAAARKHRISPDELTAKLVEMAEQLNAIDNSDAEMKKLKSEVKYKKSNFDVLAKKLTAERISARDILRKQILAELPDLKLGQADFMVEISSTGAAAHGYDEITFLIKTNPGSPFAPLHKIASGGELARLMLALRVVMGAGGAASSNPPIHDSSLPTLIFDEIDTGISGATASAVGERLARLAAESQALVITHSAQVAGFADRHFKIEKYVGPLENAPEGTTTTTVSEITGDARINEIARIISGAKITPESIATAKTLIKK